MPGRQPTNRRARAPPTQIRYHEAFLHSSKLCVVMEYAPFGDLRYYINKANKRQTPFPEEAIWRIFLQLCKGLAALHGSQIIHRDIKVVAAGFARAHPQHHGAQRTHRAQAVAVV